MLPRETFVELIQQHRGQLFGYIYALLHNLQDTEDVYQSTCLILWKKFGQFREETSFISWASEVARLEARNFLRKQSRSRVVFDSELQEMLADTRSELIDATADVYQESLAECLAQLSPADRELVRQCYETGKSFKSVAEQIDRSPKSVYDALGRIRRSLSTCVKSKISAQEG